MNFSHKLRVGVATLLISVMGISPALANTPTDEVGIATTVYQQYVIDGLPDITSVLDGSPYTYQICLDSDITGHKEKKALSVLQEAAQLASRVLPWRMNVSMVLAQYGGSPYQFYLKYNERDLFDRNTQVQNKIAELATYAKTLSNDYERLKYINDYIVDHCTYRTAAINNPDNNTDAFSTYGCLIAGSAVCEGYANAVQMYCEALHIPCVKVDGKASGGDHIWNAVYLQDRWWMLDVTFNDPVGVQSPSDRYEYFLLDMDAFAAKKTHSYDSKEYEISKEILTGRTVGQRTAVSYLDISMTNASANDTLVTDSIAPKPVAPTPEKQQEPAVIEIYGDNPTTEQKAEALKEMKLFMGDENGFRLEDSMNRVEMGVMMMRMNNGRTLVSNNEDFYRKQCVFTDVPDWARASIGFLYAKNLVAGQGDHLYGTGDVTIRDYAVVLLRVLRIDHTYDNALAVAESIGIVTSEQTAEGAVATRGDIVDMTFATLLYQQQGNTEQNVNQVQ